MIFDYPIPHGKRRHGPAGYSSYESYRPWLRDEFSFRCVYCLKREAWGQVTGEFELDHFQPQLLARSLSLDFSNLIYACRRCNAVKSTQSVADPLELLTCDRVAIDADGALQTDDIETNRLLRQLDLNSPSLKRWRMLWMRIILLSQSQDTELHRQLVGFPVNLPNLKKLRPPENLRPTGITESWYAKREKGILPDRY